MQEVIPISMGQILSHFHSTLIRGTGIEKHFQALDDTESKTERNDMLNI